MQMTEIIKINILIFRINTNNKYNIYEYINYFEDFNTDIRPLSILEFE